MNATSHVLWGQEAANHDDFSWKYTGIGLATSYLSAVFWALPYEALAPRKHTAWNAAVRGAVMSGGCYLTDYHLLPKRFTSGFELRLSRLMLGVIYGAFAVGLSLKDLLKSSRVRRRESILRAAPSEAGPRGGLELGDDSDRSRLQAPFRY